MQFGNAGPGTVVDTDIVHPVENDFYLLSHQAILVRNFIIFGAIMHFVVCDFLMILRMFLLDLRAPAGLHVTMCFGTIRISRFRKFRPWHTSCATCLYGATAP